MCLLLAGCIVVGMIIAALAVCAIEVGEDTQAELAAALARRRAWTSQGRPRSTGMAVDMRPRRPGYLPRSGR